MKTLQTAYRVSDLERSLQFYASVGYEELGRVMIADGSVLAMLTLPGDGDFVTLELVSKPGEAFVVGTGFSHIAVQVEDLSSTLKRLQAEGITCGQTELPDGEGGPRTSCIYDPDGYRIELVQWPPGHPAGLTSADFARPGQ